MGRALARRCTADRARRVAGLGAVLLASGCAQLLGVDDYRQREDGEEAGVEGCGPLEAPSPEGCTPVGVERCGEGFAADGRGGCVAEMAEECGPGMVALPGNRQCVPVGACRDSEFPDFPPFLQLANRHLYVNGNADPGGDGSADRPLRTIGEALAAAEGRTLIQIARGEYVEALEISGEPGDFVLLHGACLRETIVRPPDASSPAARISGPVEVRLSVLTLTGGAAGVRADTSASIQLGSVWIRDPGGPGVVVTDRGADRHAEDAGLHLQGPVLIERARGAGIAAYGARVVQLSRPAGGNWGLVVRGTRALEDGRDGYGIALYPSAAPTEAAELHRPPPSELELQHAVIEGSAGAGLLIEGSHARVTGTLIRDTGSEEHDAGRGVVVRRRPLGAVPASLDLSRSVVEKSGDVGILVEDWPRPLLEDRPEDPGLSVTIEDSVIRQSGGPAGCVGNGLRVRSDGENPDAVPSNVALRRSLVDASREAGVLVTSGRAELEATLVRGTAAGACGDSADGVAVYGDRSMPAEVVVTGSRIEGSDRAAVAAFGGRAVIASSALQGCSVAAHAGERGGPGEVEVTASACACEEAGCAPGHDALEPALLGGNGCEDYGGVCLRTCFDNATGLLGPGEAFDPFEPSQPVSGIVSWALDDLRLGPAITDEEGCYAWGGLPPGEQRLLATAHSGYLPVVARQSMGRSDGVPVRVIATQSSFWETFENVGQQRFDPSAAFKVGAFVCRPPERPPPDAPARRVCVHEGVPGVRLAPLSGVSGPPLYTADTFILDNRLDAMTAGSWGAFFNAEPGEVVLGLEPPPGTRLDCTTDIFDNGWGLGELTGPNQVRIPTRPGFLGAAIVFCTTDPPG